MIKLQDFARECGVTDRAIQKHLKTYAAEFEGLYQRKGPNGTWLTDEACELLRSKLKQQPVVVGDNEIYRRVADLEKENKDLTDELKDAYKSQAGMLQQISDLQQLQIEAQKATLLLEAAEKEKKILEGFIQDAKNEISHLQQEMAQKDAESRQAVESERLRSLQVENEKKALEAEFEAYKDLPWYKKWFK